MSIVFTYVFKQIRNMMTFFMMTAQTLVKPTYYSAICDSDVIQQVF